MSDLRVRIRLRAAVALVVANVAAPLQAANYAIDPAETRATFETRFLGFMPVRGAFRKTTGVLEYDGATRQGTIRAAIHAATLETEIANGDSTGNLLRGPDFFDVARFPTIDFVSTQFQWMGDRLVAIDGVLTLRKVSRPASLTIAKSHCVTAAADKPARCEATAQFVVKRSEFGMTGWAATVSDEVRINVEFVAKGEGDESAAVVAPRPVER
jgi:polyisoprenoid-binding protein YceI